MTLILTDDQLMFRDAAKRFAAERAPVSQLRKLRDDGDPTGFSRQAVERNGGDGLGRRARARRAWRRGLRLRRRGTDRHRNRSQPERRRPLLSSAVLAVTALLRGGTPAQKETLLPAIAGGDLLIAFASDECVRHTPYHIATRCTGKYKLSGRKLHVLDGNVADRLIVTARTSGDISCARRHHAVPDRLESHRRDDHSLVDGR